MKSASPMSALGASAAVALLACAGLNGGNGLEDQQDDVVQPDPEPPAGDGTCTDASDCAAGEWCARPVGACDAEGTCEPVPDDCPDDASEPVCGCDGMQYVSTCALAAAGTSALHRGWCLATGACDGLDVEDCCDHRWDCPPGFMCGWHFPDDEGPVEAAFQGDPTPRCTNPGACRPVPQEVEVSPGVPDKGCNGIVYANVVSRYVRSAFYVRTPWHPPCETNDDCAPTEWCERASCRIDSEARCQPRPTHCGPGDPVPVCACDDDTVFDGACEAAAAGMNFSRCPDGDD